MAVGGGVGGGDEGASGVTDEPLAGGAVDGVDEAPDAAALEIVDKAAGDVSSTCRSSILPWSSQSWDRNVPVIWVGET